MGEGTAPPSARTAAAHSTPATTAIPRHRLDPSPVRAGIPPPPGIPSGSVPRDRRASPPHAGRVVRPPPHIGGPSHSHQNAPAPLGVPSPVGPSYPTPAVHR